MNLDVSETGRLGYQPDIYQRYSFVRGLTRGLLRDDAQASVLDVGCGPVRLTERFLGSGFAVVRADVERFDTPDIHLIVPGQPLPFDSASFDLVLALEVLEHVAASERPAFIRELERVSRQATIVSCPVATPEVVVAERRFSEWAVAISGRDVDFLAEHRELGLPAAADVVSWFASPRELLVAENAPLADWLAFNLLDLIYAADFGDTADKQRFDTAINGHAPFYRAGDPHYRRFFCAIRDTAAGEAAKRFVLESSSTAADARDLISEVMSAVVELRDAIRSRFGVDLAAKDTCIADLTSQLDASSRAVGSLQASVTERDAQLASNEAQLNQLASQEAQLRKEFDQLGQQLAEKDAHTAELSGRIDGLAGLTASLQATLIDKEAEVASLQASLHGKEAELEEARHHLRAILGSRSWRAMAPARLFGRSVRRAARIYRRFGKAQAEQAE